MKLLRLCLFFLTAASTLLRAQNAPEKPTEIESELFEMTSTETENTLIFTNRVVVTGTNLKLTCDRLEVVALRASNSKGAIGKIQGFKSMIAIGNVILIQDQREAACGRATVLPGDDKLILQEKPVLVDRASDVTTTADEFILHRGQQRVDGKNVRIVGPALKDLGVDKDKLFEPAKTAPAPATEAPKQP